MTTEAQMVEEALVDSFIVEALALKTGLPARHVREGITELVSDALVGRDVLAERDESNDPADDAFFQRLAERKGLRA